ncbi:MAG TPA: SGNH/GDSL hydrolase family protein [Limnochordia bacterium]|nr:SGNH/GDSL hydrolase family protein [Limnochordia bacterium]
MRQVPLGDELFHGAISLERTEGWIKPWRIPYRQFALFPPDGIGTKAETPAGVRLRFRTDSRNLALEVVPREESRQCDCVVEGELLNTATLAGGERRLVFPDLPAGRKRVELYLSQKSPVALVSLEIDDDAGLIADPDTRPRWITYGSSITQCAAAASPAQTWPASVARQAELNLTCLGYGGNCHLEPMVARLIRDLPADFISVCLGINVYGAASLSPRTFRPAVIGLLEIIREKHAGIPLAVLSPIYSPPRETTKNAVGLTLVQMREEIRTAVDALRSLGDEALYYVDGLELFGPADANHLPDQLHPDADGYRLMAERFLGRVVAPLREAIAK